MRLPTWDELRKVDEQMQVLEHPLDKPLFAVGPPGSGKTVLAVHRAQMLTQNSIGEAGEASSVAIVTYNRMLRRLVSLLKNGDATPWTMQRFVWNDYQTKTGNRPPRLTGRSYDYDWIAMHSALRAEKDNKPRWRHVVIDEGQDLPGNFFRYARRYGADCLSVFADEDQALENNRTTIMEIKAAADLPKPYILSQNHRNSPQIAALAAFYHRGILPTARVNRTASGTIPRLIKSPDMGASVRRISDWFRNRSGSIGVVVNSQRTGVQFHQELRRLLPKQRVDFYDSVSRNEDSIALLEPGVTILNQRSVKGQEFDTLFLTELEQFIPCATDTMRRVMYMLCARARDHLFLVYGPNELSSAAWTDLPPPSLLERP